MKSFELLDSYPVKRGMFCVLDDYLYVAAFLTHLNGPVPCNANAEGEGEGEGQYASWHV